MNRTEVIAWIQNRIKAVKMAMGKQSGESADEEEYQAKRMFAKLIEHRLDAINKLARDGGSAEVEAFIEKELRKPVPGEQTIHMIRGMITKAYSGKKFLSAEQKEQRVQSTLQTILAAIDFKNPSKIRKFVEDELRVEDHYNDLRNLRVGLSQLGIDQDKEAEALHRKFRAMAKSFQKECPSEFERPNKFISDIEMDFAAFFNKGEMGSMGAVFQVQAKLIHAAAERLALKPGLSQLKQHSSIMISMNEYTRGAVWHTMKWASGMAKEEDAFPEPKEAKKLVREWIDKIKAPSDKNEKERLDEAVVLFDRICMEAEEAYGKKNRNTKSNG